MTWLYIMIPAAAVALVAIVIAAVLVWPRLQTAHSTQDASALPSDAATTAAGVPGGAPFGAGEVRGPLDRFTTASAPVTSADSVDGAGNTTSYEASHLLDGDPTTAWRMDGDGKGEILNFTLDTGRPIATLGLINGYAKTDPATGEDRYAENRRITHVTWIVDGQTIGESLLDGSWQMQVVSFPPVTASSVQLRIDAVTEPGARQFDRTAISDVLIAD